MKKKNVQLGKLKLSKTNIATFDQSYKIVGGSVVGPGCSFGCPPLSHTCPPAETQGCQTEFPQCQATDGPSCNSAYNVTDCNCVSQQSCDAGFLCDNQTFGGGAY